MNDTNLEVKLLTDKLQAQEVRLAALQQGKSNNSAASTRFTSTGQFAGSSPYTSRNATSDTPKDDEVAFEERAKFVMGGWDTMPPGAVLQQVQQLVAASGLGLELDYHRTSTLVTSTIWIRFKPEGSKTAKTRGWEFKKYVDSCAPILLAGSEGPAGERDNRIWIQPYRTADEKRIRKCINAALSWAHLLRECFQIPKEYQRAGFPQVVVSGDYRKNKVQARWKQQTFAKLSEEPSVSHLVLVGDEDLKRVFADDLLAAGTRWSQQVLDD